MVRHEQHEPRLGREKLASAQHREPVALPVVSVEDRMDHERPAPGYVLEMSNELAAVVTTYEVEFVGTGRMSRHDGPLDERKASDRSQGLQTTSRPEPGSCPTGEHQALHDGTAQRQWRARAINGSWDCIQGLSDATGDLQAASQEQAEARMRELRSETEAIWKERHELLDDIHAMTTRLKEVASGAAARVSTREPADGPVAAVRVENQRSGIAARGENTGTPGSSSAAG